MWEVFWRGMLIIEASAISGVGLGLLLARYWYA
jgi:hypothetical protein